MRAHVVRLFIEVPPVLACVDLREYLSHQMAVGTRRLAVTVPVVRPKTATGPGPSGDGPPRPGPAPPPGVRVEGGVRARGLPPGPEQLGELQGEGPPVPPRGKVPGEERGQGRMVRRQGMVGVQRVGEEGLLLSGVGVGFGGAGAVHTEAASHQGSPPEPIAPPAQAVGAGPAAQREIKAMIMKMDSILVNNS